MLHLLGLLLHKFQKSLTTDSNTNKNLEMDEILTIFASRSDDCLPILSGKNIYERHGKDIPWKDKSGKT